MATLTKQILERAAIMIAKHLQDYLDKIDEAYCNDDDKALTVTTKAKFSPDAAGIKIETNISFILEKITDKATDVIDPDQMPLWEEAAPGNIVNIARIEHRPQIEYNGQEDDAA